ncbi:hypothetical protein H206_05127 [Candidatus Electrothrix aarhusensis]|uniref:Uncharacterized protein n=1 Tax=Candidatus Electrothrix aarhusensis TaxID=1859131 RepID=A0A444J5D6_9BACT|nr:hypothetical protein H206_05127 [Candidatus Electrothrix aarhusensis]
MLGLRCLSVGSRINRYYFRLRYDLSVAYYK